MVYIGRQPVSLRFGQQTQVPRYERASIDFDVSVDRRFERIAEA
jgi:hypothetical protein